MKLLWYISPFSTRLYFSDFFSIQDIWRNGFRTVPPVIISPSSRQGRTKYTRHASSRIPKSGGAPAVVVITTSDRPRSYPPRILSTKTIRGWCIQNATARKCGEAPQSWENRQIVHRTHSRNPRWGLLVVFLDFKPLGEGTTKSWWY